MSRRKQALLKSGLALLLCVSMLVGTTFAWFTDSVTSGLNIIAAGNLDVELYHSNGAVKDERVTASTKLFMDLQGNPILWEPGVVSYENLRVANEGDLALVYQLALNTANENYILDGANRYGLSQVLKVGVVKGGITATDRDGVVSSVAAADWMSLASFVREGSLLADASETWGIVIYWQPGANDNNWNANNGKQLSSGDALTIDLGIHLTATQTTHEKDSFGDDYDITAKDDVFPVFGGGTATVPVSVANGLTTAEVSIAIGDITATVPAGVKVKDGTTALTLTVKTLDSSAANIVLGENEALRSLDVHVEGVAADNTAPITVTLPEVAPVALNMGNYKLYHVENGATNEMTLVASGAAFDAHNQFKYDPATGDVVLYMATFSEVALAVEEAKWEGNFDYDWYNADAKELTISNADQLAAFGAIVGGMDGQTQDSFEGQTITLMADIDLNDAEENNQSHIFYPIGYNSDDGKYEKTGVAVSTGFYTFEGIFDGNGHTISNFYHNTWEMKGDHDWYSPEEQYYRDGMGLFGRVYKATIKNLTVKNFSSDGEIATTGVIAAYADGATFENIAIFDCNPRVYNIGNGGIVGCVGWYAKEADLKTTFTNITVDNSNKISALWGSYDVACGGIVGQYYPTSGQTSAGTPKNAGVEFTNCHVSAQMDVYNDVCANYQYYAYRYTGMLIGSVRENETIDGHVYPKMDGITASGCTVHFGTWNDYYYCELVANSLASYTHDHQFSRLEQVAKVEGTTITPLKGESFTVPASGRYNYVVVNGDHATENATCYHFVDGNVHDHDDYNGDGVEDFETVNSEQVYVENNRHIYLEFNNLVTGYGWGVTTKGVGDLAGVTILDKTLDGASYEKFVGETTALTTDRVYTLDEIFSYKTDCGVKVIDGALTVTITNLDENGNVIATFTRGEKWNEGTISFENTGNIAITIQDYYFCQATTINATVTGREEEEKFEVAFDHDSETAGKQNYLDKYLYRVGNKNAVTLGTLFSNKAAITGTVAISVDTIVGNASGTYTSSATWANGTIQFSGTGVVKVTITDNDYCKETELLLEVVDATNLTSATGTTTGGTFVLLCNVNTSTYVNYWNCTLYGNGFTYSLKGAPTTYNSKQGHGILITKNATLDNLVIVGDVYDEYGAYTTNNDYNAAIDVMGDTIIQNCYISGCSAPVSARANATITNTTLYGGAVANLIIKSGTVTLNNVTTANFNDSRNAPIGMGIVIHSDATETAKLVLNGTLRQYNFLNEEDTPIDTYAKNLHDTMFGDSLKAYHFGTSPNRYVNTGIVSLTATFDNEDIEDNANTGYTGASVTLSGVNGYVYTQPNTSGSVNNNYDMDSDSHVSTTQGAVPPSYSFDYTNKNYVAKTDGSNDYCYEENGKVNISMDEGDTFNWDTSILTIGKGITVYTVSMNGTDYTGKSIAFNTAGDFVVEYTYTDPYNFKLDENGNITTYDVTYTKTVSITVAVVEAATKHAEFTFGSSNTASTTVTIDNNTYVMPNVSATSSTIGSTTVSGQTIYYPIVEIIMSDNKTSHTSGWYAYFPVFSGAVTITDYQDNGLGDAETFGSSTQSMPSGLSIVGDPAQLFKYQSSSTAGTSPVVKNNILVYSSPSISANRSEYNTVIQYSYQDNAGSTYYYYIGYHAPAQSYSSICVTPDTLITLADGSQKPINQVTYADRILVWDFVKGEYVAKPSTIVMNHGYNLYDVVTLNFDDGTTVNTINGHGFFNVQANKFVILSKDNVERYIGHDFVKDADKMTTAKLISYSISTEYTESWSVLTSEQYNCLLEGMLTITPAEVEGSADVLMPYEIGADMKYDAAKMQADIEKYGLYTYEDFADYCTYEQFVALGLENFKVSVAKGYITWDEIIFLLNLHMN